MVNMAWIDRPVDTRGCAPRFHAFLKRSMEARHAKATATRESACFGNSAVSETRKLAAILVSDVGYSRLAGADEDRILARLRTLRSDLIDPTIAVHHGRIVKRTAATISSKRRPELSQRMRPLE
jgi:class 3 adenylate cyclase